MSERCARTLAAAIENSSIRTVSGRSSSSISRPQLVEVEQPLGDEEGGDDLLERGAFLLGQVEGDARAEAVDEPVGDLGGDDLVAQPVGADRVGMRLAHRLGEGVEQLAARPADRRPAAAPRPRPAARAWRSTARPPARAGSGRDFPAPRRSSSSLDAEPLDLAVEPARRFEQLDRPDVRRAAPCAPPASAIDSASVCSRLSSSTMLGDVVGHLARAGGCACRTTAGPRASRG